jgi:putative Mg2+ transporter-C (MgtC) family protein
VNDQIYELGLVALAALLGGLVGFERTRADKPAGLRTHMLVAGGAALIIILGQVAAEEAGVSTADPARALHAVITGIGFLGAGTILHSRRGDITGLTTAASLLVAAAIGMAVAFEKFALAVGVTVLVLLTLTVLGFVEHRLERLHPTDPGDDGQPADDEDRAAADDRAGHDDTDGASEREEVSAWRQLTGT